jgi:hypothetical protein
MSEIDIDLLMELLENTLSGRDKGGCGGYSSATFSLKSVLLSLRCLLTHTSNQLAVATKLGMKTNYLLMKSLGIHAARPEDAFLDAESAEYAAFSLYLLSNYGFEDLAFLPSAFAPSENDENMDDLAAKVLTCYLARPNIRPAGKHAAEQLLLRIKYLNYADSFDGNVSSI